MIRAPGLLHIRLVFIHRSWCINRFSNMFLHQALFNMTQFLCVLTSFRASSIYIPRATRIEPSHIGMMTRIPSRTFPYLEGMLSILLTGIVLTPNCSSMQHLAIARTPLKPEPESNQPDQHAYFQQPTELFKEYPNPHIHKKPGAFATSPETAVRRRIEHRPILTNRLSSILMGSVH